MTRAISARSNILIMLALLVSLGLAAPPALAGNGRAPLGAPPVASHAVAADERVVQDDPDNPIKFSIDAAIANGSVSTRDLFIGTVESYLGDDADGKTPVFQDGFGVHPHDILIMNDRVGIVLAAGTDDPWGYPGGSILDAGSVTVPADSPDLKGATFGPDTILTAQFLFNGWDAWAPSNAGMVYFDLVNYNFETKAIDNVDGVPAVQATRKFDVPYNLDGVSTARDLDVISYYSIAPDKDYAYWFDTVRNNGAAFSTQALNEVVLSNKGSVGIDTKTVAALSAANTFNWVADDDGDPTSQFSTTVISPGANPGSDGRTHPFSGFTGARGYRELQFTSATRPYVEGETRLYESYLMIDDEASWQKVYDFWADYKGLQTFNVSGTVTDPAGDPVAYPTVIVNRGSTLYGSVMGDEDGNYSIDLPNENTTQTYSLRIEKEGTVPSAASAGFTSATVPAGGVALQTGAYKVPVTFKFEDQNGDPIWGRISVGTLPTMIYTGENYYFSDVKPDGSIDKGVVTAMVAPGDYSATAWGEGYGFYSYTTDTGTFNRTITGNTTDNPVQTVVINKPISAPTDWFGVDNHHHGGRMDSFSPPVVSANSQVTAGLEVASLADHQYVLDNCPVYDWSRKLGVTGYMPNEEITPSWAHHNMMPLTEFAYDRFRDCAQVNPVINTNTHHQGIIDDAHNQGIAIGVNHPNSSYGLFLADDDRTVPGGMSGDFDGIEIQGFGATTINEAFSFWSAYLAGGEHRGVEVKRPHYIHGSTDIHDSGQGTSSGSQRSYVHVEDGKLKSAADFDDFSLEFSRSQAAGHSFVSNGAFITPTSGKVFGETYSANQDGTFTADFNISALNNITDIYVFGSTGAGTATGGFNGLTKQISRTTYSGGDLTNSRDFTLTVNGVQGKQWFALGAVSSSGNRRAITNPIWVNGPDVPAEQTIASVKTVLNEPKAPDDGGAVEQPATSIMTTTPWSGFNFADWEADPDAPNRIYTLTFTAPSGSVFDPALTDDSEGIEVWTDGDDSKLTYRVDLHPPVLSDTPTITGSAKVGETLTAVPGTWDDGVSFSYLWAVDGRELSAETGKTYTPAAADVGKPVTVKVTGAKPGRTTVTKESEPTANGVVGDLNLTPTPAVTGDPRVGETLTAVPGTWSDGVTLAYQWAAGGDAIDGATSPTYTAVAGDDGRTLTVTVTGTKSGYAAASKTSAPTSKVGKGTLASTPTPSISGTPTFGRTLTVVAGDWDAGTTLAYQWLVNGSPVAGATSATYALKSRDVGKRVAVVVTGSKPSYESVRRTSASTTAVTAAAFANTLDAKIKGKAKVGKKLKAKVGSWPAGAKISYNWTVGGKVKGSKPTLRLKKGMRGKRVRLVVTVSMPGYVTQRDTARSGKVV